ncbi:MAG TPA: tRNA lysidine(34) synthetase TilS, partial [Candidatus Binataceae bacterium]|nr:tRNA lysidine(34) synthetase TilS [Candidatus Binataceae bacterium]
SRPTGAVAFTMMKPTPSARFICAIADSLTRIGVARDALILVALSGGPDSVALLHAMLSLRERFDYRIAAAHFNHRIRVEKDEADRDEAFVRALCERLGVELIVDRAEGLSPSTPNLEERARDARHAFLNSAAERLEADLIALAHHAGDQAETVMIRILRGAGASGLSAMAERGPGRTIRPMLDVTRTEVLAYLKSIGESFVIDSSNQSNTILRNRIRNQLVPMLERDYAPRLGERLFKLAAEMRALDDFVTAAARKEIASALSQEGLDISRFAALHPALQAEVIRQFFESQIGNLRRIERVHIEAVRQLCLDGPPNGSLDIPGGIRLAREYGRLKVSARPDAAPSFMIKLNEQGRTEIPAAHYIFDASVMSAREAGAIENKFEALFDAREAAGGLIARSFQLGDKVAPLGMNGHRKVKGVFIDNKLSPSDRARFPIVELKGAIAWLPGLVRGRVGLVTEASTSVLRLRAKEIVR